jgi:hypothetical protein
MMGYYGMLEDNEHMMEYVKKLADIGDAAGMWCIIRPIPVQFPEVLQGTSEA